MFGKQRVGLDGQVVDGNVRRLETQSCLNILRQIAQCLTRQGIHQIQVEGFKRRLRFFNGSHRLISVVHAAKGLQMSVIETLHANGQARHTGRTKSFEAVFFKGTRVGFQSNFSFCLQRQSGPDAADQSIDAAWREQTGCATANENAVNRPAPHQRQTGF